MVVASIALLVALGGTSIAAVNALPNNSVGTPQLKGNAVISSKVKNGSLLSADFKVGQIPPGPAGPAGPQGAAGPAGAAGPSDAYAKFLNGPIAVPLALTTLVNLSIPQGGKYVIYAKLAITQTGGWGIVGCQLVAGADTDASAGTVWAPGTSDVIANNVVHEFAGAGSVDYRCTSTVGGINASNIKITAIKVGNLTNSG